MGKGIADSRGRSLGGDVGGDESGVAFGDSRVGELRAHSFRSS